MFLQTHFQALLTPSERHLKSNQNVQWRPPIGPGAATETSDCSSDVSQRELRELESGFAETLGRLLVIYTADLATIIGH
jgi:hypothetical protein